MAMQPYALASTKKANLCENFTYEDQQKKNNNSNNNNKKQIVN